MPDAPQIRFVEAVQMVDVLESAMQELKRATSPDARTGSDKIPERVVLDVYARAVRELRAVAREARGRIERASAEIAEAREFARRRRRRANKIATRRNAGS